MRFFKKLKLHKLFEIAEEELAYHYDKIDSIGNNLQKKEERLTHPSQHLKTLRHQLVPVGTL